MDNSKFSKRSLLVLSMAALLAVGGVAAAAGGLTKTPAVEASDTTYTFAMDGTHQIASDKTIAVGSTAYKVAVSYSDGAYTAGTGTFGSFTSGSNLFSTSKLYGIKSITANLASGSMQANFAYSSGIRQIAVNPVNFVAGTASTIDIEGAPDYFYFEFKAATVVTSISLTYTCNALADPVQESDDLLDLSAEAEGLSAAGTLSWMTSTTKVSSGTRAHHIVAPAITTGWPSLLVRLNTPVVITATGHFVIDGWADTGVKAWVGLTCYGSNWSQIGSLMSTDVGTAAWATATTYQTPTAAGTAAFIRIGFNLDDTKTVPFSMYLDNLHFVAA